MTLASGKLKLLALIQVVALVVLGLFLLRGSDERTLTAHFDRAIAVYPGTDLRVMGVQIGKVTSVVPEGNSVRVEMKYDAQYKLPADARAAVVTPTLVADRYVQVFPAYGSGPVMSDGADIPLNRTQTPVELDRMFKALDDLSTTLGPQSSSTRGSLAKLLETSADALEGNGELGSEMIRNLSAAADTFARNRGPLFENVRALADLTNTLADEDDTVQDFLKSLSSVSDQLAGERDDLESMLAALADVLGIVEDFIAENRAVLGEDLKRFASVLERVDRQKDALGLVVQKGPLAMGNLAVSYEPSTSTFGSRVQITPQIQFRPDQFLCDVLVVRGAPPAACTLIQTLLTPLLPATSGASAPASPDAASAGSTPATVDGQPTSPLTVPTPGGDLAGSLQSVPDVLSSIVEGALQ
ncbi:MAG TPA: MCE family protein, partial [Aeromicrobium sp.]|nr:MCE family protein [Aeromicrobium sp.]